MYSYVVWFLVLPSRKNRLKTSGKNIVSRVKADSFIACRSHAVPLPCRAAKGLECVFPIWFTECGRAWFTLAMPCPCQAVLLKVTAQHGHLSTAMLCCGLEKNGMAGEQHGKCESDTSALCKSNGKDTFSTLSGTAWQGNGMGMAWERHAMRESAFTLLRFSQTSVIYSSVTARPRAKSHSIWATTFLQRGL